MSPRPASPGADASEPALATDAELEAWGFPPDVFGDRGFRVLASSLRDMGRVAVAYSGGVDSTMLLRVAHGVLGEEALGVLGFSESLDRSEFDSACAVVETTGARYEVIETDEYSDPRYRRNDGDRCYHCKSELFDRVTALAAERGIPWVLDGSNADDAGDYRPGMRARDERGVRSPLMEAGLDKETIRRYSRALGLPTWDKPAAPCLASRIPYGSEVTQEKLRAVEAAEGALRELGLRVVRVRHHGQVARIEVPVDDLERLLSGDIRLRAIEAVRRAGFEFVALDLEGFRSGSLNRALGDAAEGSAGVVPIESIGRIDDAD